jgi:hypothetical protein
MRKMLGLWIMVAALCSAGGVFGTWKLNPARSTFGGETRPKSLTARIESHGQAEVFTVDRIEADGRIRSSSTILHLDGEPRSFQDFECSGLQISRRLDDRTVEILRMCATGDWIRLVRHSALQAKELVFKITKQRPNGHRLEFRLVLEKR